jgi:hypothetical protein
MAAELLDPELLASKGLPLDLGPLRHAASARLLTIGRQCLPAKRARCGVLREPATLLLCKGVPLLPRRATKVLLGKCMGLLPRRAAALTNEAMTLLTFSHSKLLPPAAVTLLALSRAKLLASAASGLLMTKATSMCHPRLGSRESSTLSAGVAGAATKRR